LAAEPQPVSKPGPVPSPDQPGAPASPEITGGVAPGGSAGLPHHALHRTRISGVWVAVSSFAVVLLLLLIFILQNSRTVDVSYFGAHGHLPLGVALLLAAVAGILLLGLPGAARIVQLRATARRHRRLDARYLATGQAPSPDGAGPPET